MQSAERSDWKRPESVNKQQILNGLISLHLLLTFPHQID
jgi:hypothetical protein